MKPGRDFHDENGKPDPGPPAGSPPPGPGRRVLVLRSDSPSSFLDRVEAALGPAVTVARYDGGTRPAAPPSFDAAILPWTEPTRTGLTPVSHGVAAHPQLPVIVVTPEGFGHLAPAALQLGAQDLVPAERFEAELGPAIEKAIERGRRTARLELEVSHDDLTGLPRRPLFLHQLSVELDRLREDPQRRIGVLLLNLDRFKLINDSLGPTFGDQLLVAQARRIKRCLRSEDLVARLGGGEFAILVRQLESESHGPSLCQCLQRETAAPFLFGGTEVFTTGSIGLVSSDVACEDAENLLRNASIALHAAKSQGNGRYRVYEPSLHEQVELRFRREMEMRQSISQKDFSLRYQPIIDLASGELRGFEALLRWEHPIEGFIPPDTFIPIAEETGLIVPIERWVLRASCEQLRQWRNLMRPEQEIHLHVNLSGKHLGRPELAAELGSILRELQLDPHWLSLEITESALVENEAAALDLLGRLRRLGCTLSIDDFGTGYSSLACLGLYPLDTLKIDRSFVDRMGADPQSQLLVRTILSLADGYGLDVVAEGIETVEQLTALRDLGCSRGQGYLISRPVDRERATEIVTAAMQGRPFWSLESEAAA